jgi:hypothetical protein
VVFVVEIFAEVAPILLPRITAVSSKLLHPPEHLIHNYTVAEKDD